MDKVLVAGQPLLDSVWERGTDRAQQEALYRYLKLAPGTSFLLVNIEPSAEHSYCSWEKHWENFSTVMQAVSAYGMPVVLSLHPLCDAPRYDFAMEKYSAFICKDYKIHDLYPFCGISISFPCSTNLLSPVFNKPLIIFDFHGLTTADEDSAFVHALPGAKLAHSGAELSGAIAATLNESRAGGVATRPARLASETIFDTVVADLGDMAVGVRAAASGTDDAQGLLMNVQARANSDSMGASMIALARDLCAFRAAVVSDDNEKLFAHIGQELPLQSFRFKSGDEFNGWSVPQNWRVKRAMIFKDGREVFDATAHTLGVAYYSKSFSGALSRAQLEKHLVTNSALPDAFMFHCMWQYRPWDADWAISMPHNVYKTLGDGEYRVELETQYEPGEMLVAHAEVKGRSDKVIVFDSHTCHPHMANDGFAGTAVLIRLMQWLTQRDNRYTYRLVFAPEHLGTVFYLRDLPRAEVERMICGVFEEMPGTAGAIKVTKTFKGGHRIDRAFANVLKHHSRVHEIAPWRKGAGNDETVWEAPGYEVPFVEVTRCEDQFAPFREYHSSLDTPDLMDEGQLDEMLEVMKKVVEVLEGDAFVTRKFDGLICLSNPKYNLYMERPDPAVVKDLDADAEKWGHLLDCLFRYMDGDMTVLDIAEKHDLPFDRLLRYLKQFEEKGLVSFAHAEIARVAPKRVGA